MLKLVVLVYWLGMAPVAVSVEASSAEEAYRSVCKMPVAKRSPTAMAIKDEDGGVPRDTRYSVCWTAPTP